MLLNRRSLMLGVAAAASRPALGRAQAPADGTMRLVAGYPAAGTSGQLARLIAPALGESLGLRCEVVDALGQDGNLAAAEVVKAVPDGRTLLLTTTGMVTFNEFVHQQLPFDPKSDLAAVSLVADVANVLLATPKAPFKSVAELLRVAKDRAGQISYARVDAASTNTLAMHLLINQSGIRLDFKPDWDLALTSMKAVADGEVDLSMQNLPTALAWIQDGRLAALATTGRRRALALPHIPTVGETLPGYQAAAWFGVMAPIDTPRTIVRTINGTLDRFLARPETQARFAVLGAETIGGSADDFEFFIMAERSKWRRVVTAAGIGRR